MRQDIERLIELERESGIDMSYFETILNPELDGHSDGVDVQITNDRLYNKGVDFQAIANSADQDNVRGILFRYFHPFHDNLFEYLQ